MSRVQRILQVKVEVDKMAKTVSKSTNNKVKKYKDGSTGSFSKIKSNGVTKWIKSGFGAGSKKK